MLREHVVVETTSRPKTPLCLALPQGVFYDPETMFNMPPMLLFFIVFILDWTIS